MRIGFTGTPGTGKTTLAKALAKELKLEYFDVNKFIDEKKMYLKRPHEEEKIVEMRDLGPALAKALEKKKDVVLDSHLLCEFPLSLDVLVVLRCKPEVLRARLQERGYLERKTEDNVMVEALDYCLIKAEEHYPHNKILQLDSTNHAVDPVALAKRIKAGGKGDEADWSSFILDSY